MVFWQQTYLRLLRLGLLRSTHLMKVETFTHVRSWCQRSSQKRPTPTAHATRRRGPVAMVLVAPAFRALGRGLLLAQHHPPLHMRVRCAAIQRGAQAGAAGACVSAAPDGVPRSRRACKGAAKVAGKGTPLPGGALWAHFRKLGCHWSQLCNVAHISLWAMSTTVHRQNFKAQSPLVQKICR